MHADDEIDQVGPAEGITSPEQDTKDATTPPDNPEVDEAKLAAAEDELGQAGGGH